MFSDSSKAAHKAPLWWGQLPWNWLEALALGLLLVAGVDVVLALLLQFMGLNLVGITGGFTFYVFSRLLGLGLLWLILKNRDATFRDLGFRSFKIKASFKQLLGSVALFLIASELILLAAEHLLPSINFDQPQENFFLDASGNWEISLAVIALVVVAPIFEEVIFRGLLLPALTKRFNLFIGVVVSSLLFGLVHLQIPVIVVTSVMGLLLAWLYYRSGSLWPAILFHSLKNIIAVIIIF
ncbi:MAG: CPBP family intramembrane glutamic endopeptidase [Candidatus Saccharimonadales bacterium]